MVARNRDNGEGTWPPPCLGGWVSWEIRSQRAGVMCTCRWMLWGRRKSLLARGAGRKFPLHSFEWLKRSPSQGADSTPPRGAPLFFQGRGLGSPSFSFWSLPPWTKLASLVPFLDSPDCSTTPVLPKSLDSFRSQLSHL